MKQQRSFEDQLIIFGSSATFLVIFPLALFRFSQGEMTLGFIDMCISMILVLTLYQCWNSIKIKHFNLITIPTFMICCLCVLHVKGVETISWGYAGIVANYFFLSPKRAILMNTLWIFISIPIILQHITWLEIAKLYPTLFLVSLFGFLICVHSRHENHKLSKLATVDKPTQIENRRSLDMKLSEIVSNNKRYSLPVSLLVMDLDFFKKVNDLYGHSAGDKVLLEFAHTIKLSIRNTDCFYRFGGEEFVLIASNSSLEKAGKLADKLRKITEKKLIDYNVTVSIGISEISEYDSVGSWFDRADQALYHAKKSGRNVVYLTDSNTNNSYMYQSISHNSVIKPLKDKIKTHIVIEPFSESIHT